MRPSSAHTSASAASVSSIALSHASSETACATSPLAKISPNKPPPPWVGAGSPGEEDGFMFALQVDVEVVAVLVFSGDQRFVARFDRGRGQVDARDEAV